MFKWIEILKRRRNARREDIKREDVIRLCAMIILEEVYRTCRPVVKEDERILLDYYQVKGKSQGMCIKVANQLKKMIDDSIDFIEYEGLNSKKNKRGV